MIDGREARKQMGGRLGPPGERRATSITLLDPAIRSPRGVPIVPVPLGFSGFCRREHVLFVDLSLAIVSPQLFWPASTAKIDECQMAGKDPTVSFASH